MRTNTLCLLLLCISFSIIGRSQPGSLDSSFSTNGRTKTLMGVNFSNLNYITIQNDGKILAVGGAVMGLQSTDSFALARYMPDGSPDKKFGNKGKLIMGIGTSFSYATYATTLPDKKILVAGYSGGHYNSDFVLLQLKENGTPDSSFGTNGIVFTDINVQDIAKQIILQPDGKIIMTGNSNNQAEQFPNTDIAMVRYFANGRIDSSFGTNGKVVTNIAKSEGVFSVQLRDDGKLMLAGFVSFDIVSDNFLLARYKQNGRLDSSFGVNGYLLSEAFKDYQFTSVAAQKDNKYVVAALCSDTVDNINFAALRFKQDASLDKAFAKHGITSTDFFGKSDIAQKVLIQKDGKVIVTGYTRLENNSSAAAVVRYDEKGVLDSSFGINGKVCNVTKKYSELYAAALQDDGKIVVGGYVDVGQFPVYSCFLVARLIGNGEPAVRNNIENNIELKGLDKIGAFPNPVTDEIHISGLNASQTYNFTIADFKGSVVATKLSIKDEVFYTLRLYNLSKGLYYLTVSSNDGKKTFKFLKQ